MFTETPALTPCRQNDTDENLTYSNDFISRQQSGQILHHSASLVSDGCVWRGKGAELCHRQRLVYKFITIHKFSTAPKLSTNHKLSTTDKLSTTNKLSRTHKKPPIVYYPLFLFTTHKLLTILKLFTIHKLSTSPEEWKPRVDEHCAFNVRMNPCRVKYVIATLCVFLISWEQGDYVLSVP